MTTLSEFIDQYRADGLSFFAIPSRSKQATTAWKDYQIRQPTDAEIQHWKLNGVSNIAIVCGAVSGNLIVIDFDSQDKFFAYCDLLLNKGIDIFTYTRLVRTSKGMHVYFRLPTTIKSTKFPQVDLKAEGGYVIAPPSIHPTGAVYEFVNPDIPIRQIESLKDVGIDVDQKPESPTTPIPEGQIVPSGQQNDWLFRQASSYRHKGDTVEAIIEKLRIDVKRCLPNPDKAPWTESDLRTIAESAGKYPSGNTGYKTSYI